MCCFPLASCEAHLHWVSYTELYMNLNNSFTVWITSIRRITVRVADGTYCVTYSILYLYTDLWNVLGIPKNHFQQNVLKITNNVCLYLYWIWFSWKGNLRRGLCPEVRLRDFFSLLIWFEPKFIRSNSFEYVERGTRDSCDHVWRPNKKTFLWALVNGGLKRTRAEV